MKNKKTILSLFVSLSILLVGFSYETITAKDKNKDNEEITDYDRSGYEDWIPDYNPKAREMYGGYEREGNFFLINKGNPFLANRISVYWKSSGVGTRFYVPNVGWIDDSNALTYREYKETTGNFVLNRACSVFQFPIFDGQYITSEVLPAGTYQVTKEALEFVELRKPNGTTVWVTPQYYNNGGYISSNQGYFTESKAILSAKTINGVPLKEMFMPFREDKRTGIAMQPKYVTIHNTASTGVGANAEVHAKLQINDARKWVSWHYSVDNNEIYQSIPMNEVAYHAGDGQNIGNSTTIGIEICENADGNYAQAERNAAFLTAQILFENGMPSDAVRMHKDWSGKNCAHNIIESTKGTMGWVAFKNLVKQEYDKLVVIATPPDPVKDVDKTIPNGFENFITIPNFKFNEGMATGFALKASIGEVKSLIKSVDETAVVQILNTDGAEATGKIATGQKVIITKQDSNTFKFIAVIKGDVNGDGEIFATDYVKVKNDIMGRGNLISAYRLAADVNNDDKIFATDYVKIKNHIMGKGLISQ